MTRKKLIVLGAIILAAVLVVLGIWLFKGNDHGFLFGTTTDEHVKEACVIEITDSGSLLVYMDSTLSTVPTEKAEFVSYDESVKGIADIKEGTVIRFTTTDLFRNANFPSSYNNVKKIETWGKVDSEAYEAGSKFWQDWLDSANSLVEEAEKQSADTAD